MIGLLARAALMLGVALAALSAPASTVSRPAPHAEGPPLAHTGGFGEPTCHACHNELELDAPEAGRLQLHGLPDQYAPGATYVVTVTLTSEGMERAGFEAAFRFAGTDPPGVQAGALASIDERVSVSYLGLTPVYYARSTEVGARTAGPETASWSFAWTAPPSGGAVAAHVAANSANGDNSPLGDFILTAADTVPSAP